MEKAQMNSQMNAQSQQQSIAAKAQADAQLEQMQSQGKLLAVQTEMKMKQDLAEQEFVQMVMMKSYELGKPLSPELQSIVSAYYQKKQMEQAAIEQQAMMEQQQAAEAEQGMMEEQQ